MTLKTRRLQLQREHERYSEYSKITVEKNVIHTKIPTPSPRADIPVYDITPLQDDILHI